MTPKERVWTAIRHRQTDIVPWSLGFTDAARAKVAEYYGDPRLSDAAYFDAWVGNHIRSVVSTGRGQFHGLEEEVAPGRWRDGWGVVWDTRGLFGEGEWGRPINVVLPEPSLKNFRFPEPPADEAYSHYERFVTENQDHFILAHEGHLFEAAWALRGIESFLMDLVLHPAFVEDLLDGITEYYLGMIEQSLEYDVDAFAFGDDLGSQNLGLMMGPVLWRKLFKPRMERLFAKVKDAGKAVYLHSDGQVDAIFPDLIEIGLDIYNPFQPEIRDVYQVKRMYGDRLCFFGGVGIQALLPRATADEVRAEVQRMLDELGAGGGFILGPSHAVMADAPVENLVALIETVKGQ
ncbi:MAG: hypothetical protein MUQ10_05890 [Anaerolineae bacterium]|nr:hypothetical protein [Anaerolineae bacterium]